MAMPSATWLPAARMPTGCSCSIGMAAAGSGSPSPGPSEFEGLPRSVSLGRDGTVWIAGTKTATDGREPRGFVAHGKDGVWRVDTLDTTDDLRSEVMAVLATDDGAVAAANVGASLLVLQACGENTGRVAAAAAKSGKKVTRRKLKVSQMQRRRATQALDFEFEHEYHDPAGIALDTPATRGVGLAADGRVRVATIAGTPINHKAFRVVNMAKQSGLKSWTPTYGGLTADFDGNRAPDVFYSRHGGIMPRLAVNAGGTFSSAPTGAFGSVDRHGCAAGDLDADGNQDILCAVGASRGKAVKRHELSLAPGTEGRALVRGALGISDPFGRGRVAAVFKLNKDKYPEVFIGNAPDRDDGFPGYNRFYRNVKGRMVPAPGMGLDTSHGATCAVAGDVDQDGDEDLVYCTQYGFGGRPPGIRFMRNEGGRLKDRTKALADLTHRRHRRGLRRCHRRRPQGPHPAGPQATAREQVDAQGLPHHLRGRADRRLGRGGRGRQRRQAGGHLHRAWQRPQEQARSAAREQAQGQGLRLGQDPEHLARHRRRRHRARLRPQWTDRLRRAQRPRSQGPVQLLASFRR